MGRCGVGLVGPAAGGGGWAGRGGPGEAWWILVGLVGRGGVGSGGAGGAGWGWGGLVGLGGGGGAG